jgi:hypothetical protein
MAPLVCTLEPRLNIGDNIFAWGTAELFLRFIAKHSRDYLVRRQSGQRFAGKTAVTRYYAPYLSSGHVMIAAALGSEETDDWSDKIPDKPLK